MTALCAAVAVAKRLALILRRRSDNMLAVAHGTLLASFAKELRKDTGAA